jgi:DNA-directed RNA polymerase specialized sigma24 family protein
MGGHTKRRRVLSKKRKAGQVRNWFGIGVEAGNTVARDSLAAALRTLPKPEADVIRHYSEGRRFETIGQEMGLSRKEVRRIWARGVKRLKAKFERNS